MDAEDEVRSRREASLNGLEAYIYKCKELTWEDDFEEITTSSEQEAIKSAVSDTSEWFEDYTEKTPADDFNSKKKLLFDIVGPIFKRRREISLRPKAVERFQKDLDDAKSAFEKIKGVLDLTDITIEEYEKSQKVFDDLVDWFTGVLEKQASLKSNVEPAFVVADLKEKQRQIVANLSKLDIARRLKKVQKPKADAKGDSKSSFTQEDLEKMKESMKGKSSEEIEKMIQDQLKKFKPEEEKTEPKSDEKSEEQPIAEEETAEAETAEPEHEEL